MRKATIIKLLFFLSTFIFQNSYLQTISNQTCTYTSYATIDVLVALYSNTAWGKITKEDISKIENAVSVARDFFWRNSGCKLNINLTYLEVLNYKTNSIFSPDGRIQSHIIETDLKNLNVEDNQYGIIVTIFSPTRIGKSASDLYIMGKSALNILYYPCNSKVLYPIEDAMISNEFIWLFSSQLLSTIDQTCYRKSGCTNMWNIAHPLDYAIDAGEDFSYLAELLRHFDGYLKIEQPWGIISHSIDMDGDGMVDNDSNLPMDEKQYGSDSTNVDSDSDGLPDLAEYMAGIYTGSNPKISDTDFDGLTDDVDSSPLNSSLYEIPKLTPDFDGDLNTWFLISDTLVFSVSKFTGTGPLKTKIYLSWDENFLYFASVTNAPAELHFDLDLNNDGWWHGNDNCRLVVDSFSDRFVEIRTKDTTERARTLSENLNRNFNEMWDDEPKYITRFGRLIDEFSFQLSTQTTETNFSIRIAIPTNKAMGFNLAPDKKIGIRVYYHPIYAPSENQWASIFEPYSFFDIILK